MKRFSHHLYKSSIDQIGLRRGISYPIFLDQVHQRLLVSPTRPEVPRGWPWIFSYPCTIRGYKRNLSTSLPPPHRPQKYFTLLHTSCMLNKIRAESAISLRIISSHTLPVQHLPLQHQTTTTSTSTSTSILLPSEMYWVASGSPFPVTRTQAIPLSRRRDMTGQIEACLPHMRG